jgi:hypothetical protein
LGATNPKNSANTAVSKYDYHDFAPHFYSKNGTSTVQQVVRCRILAKELIIN